VAAVQDELVIFVETFEDVCGKLHDLYSLASAADMASSSNEKGAMLQYGCRFLGVEIERGPRLFQHHDRQIGATCGGRRVMSELATSWSNGSAKVEWAKYGGRNTACWRARLRSS